MKFNVQSREMLRVLNAVSKVIQKKNSLPIYETVLLSQREEDGVYTLTGSSPDNSLTMAIDIFPHPSDTDAFSPVCLPTSQLLSAMAALSDQPVEITINPDYSTIVKYQGGQFTLMSFDASEYPTFPNRGESQCSFTVPTNIFIPAVKSSVNYTETSELRPVFTAVCLDVKTEGVVFVGTDGASLYKYEYNHGVPFLNGKERAILIPRTAISAIEAPFRDEETITVDHDGNHVALIGKRASFYIRDIEGRYPNYNAVIRKESPYHATLAVRDLMEAVKRVGLMASAHEKIVAINMVGEILVVHCEDVDYSCSAKERVNTTDCTLPSGYRIGVKYDILMRTLNSIGTESVCLYLDSASQPVVLREVAPNSALTCMAMPILLNN